MKGAEILASFFLGGLLAAFAATYVNEKSCQDTLRMFAQAERARAIDRANSAYHYQPLIVARWELEHLTNQLQSNPFVHEDPKMTAFHEFLTSARLAKIYRDLGEYEAYTNHLHAALHNAKQFKSGLTNAESLFAFLEDKDRPPKPN